MMNKYFIPTFFESEIINKIINYYREEYVLIRLTETMLKKGIIDASQQIRELLSKKNIVDYEEINKYEYIRNNIALILTEKDIIETTISFGRPGSKNGDPRFCIYKLTRYCKEGNLLFITINNGKIIIIPLINEEHIMMNLPQLLSENPIEKLKDILIDKLTIIKNKEWILSTNSVNNSHRDVGLTLERELNIPINVLRNADIEGKIEVKSKREKSKNRNTLFSQVPDWSISTFKNAHDILLKYGFPSPKHPLYKTMYMTVRAIIPNPQGFIFELDDKKGLLCQNIVLNNSTSNICFWKNDKLKERLFEKHPITLWVDAEEKFENGHSYFKYKHFELTHTPIFAQFLLLLSLSKITMDWTHRILPDGSNYNDHGNLFKISNKERSLLFDSTQILDI